ncbi:cadherin-like domain-containing protein, partial [Bacillus subtilis]|nr:cadherin-like domain-containing protein [Bacillus subtilis]
TVTAEAVFTDAAGNDADPVTGSVNYSVDVTAPGAPALELANDTGVDGDGISSVGTVTVTNLESGAQWEYSTDNGVTWNNGTGTSFVLPQGDYAAGAVQVRQTDSAGNTGTAGSLGATSIISLQGANDAADADMGTRESVTHAPVSDENLQLLGLLDNGSQAAGISFTVGQGSTGDIVIQVSQNALIAVADAFNVEIYDAAGNLVHVLTTGNDPLVGDVLGTGILGLTGDNTLVANITGLAPGEYKVVVRKGESALGTLLDADGNGVSLQELGQGGVVLGQENQALVLAAIENALNGALLPGLNLPLGTVVKNILLPVLDTTTALGAGDLVEVLSNSLNALGLSHLLDQVLGAVAHALLNNTLTLIQDTSVSVSLTEHSFADGDTPVSGNVIDPDINADGEAGEDQVVPGTKVTQIENSDGEVIQLNNGSATIEGNHGTLVINADGSYTYTPNGSPASVGQSDTFSYTISDGTNSTTANLTINIDGALVTNDTAQAGIEYEYLVTAGVNMNDAISDSWLLTLTPRERTSASLTVAENTTQDVTLTIDAGNLLGLGGSVVVYVEVRTPGTNTWTSHATYNSSQLLSLLGSGGPGKILVPDLDAGEYRIRTVTTGIGVAGSFSVDITSEVTHLDQYAPNPHAFSAHGDLFANDLVGADIPPLSISHDGTTFTNVVSGTPQVVQGAYGSLQINADGTYTYTPDSRASVGGEYTDTFTYRIEHNGTYQEATLTVTINTTVQGDTVDSGAAMVAFSIDDADVVPMNDLLADADDTPAGQDHNMADLLQDFALDDGGNDVTLPFSDTMSDEFEPASIFTENLTAPLTTMIPEDPLAHLVLDPLIKDDDLHSMHIA